MKNHVTLLDNDIIYVEKIGDQTAASMRELFAAVMQLGTQLRAENKPVLVLSNASQEGKTDVEGHKVSAEIGKTWDFDKSATYGSSAYLEVVRNWQIEATQLDQKVANFKTREEALAWLLK